MSMTPEMETLKSRLKTSWMAGDYGHFAKFLEPGALEFLARLNIAPGTRMLDVACGAGQLAIPAARNGVRVTGVDIATNWIEQARARARTEGLDVRFEEGDAEILPFGDGEFDWMLSLIGAMFAPRHGPANRAFAILDDAKQAALRRDLENLWSTHNKTTGEQTVVEAEYLEVIATRA